jgi:hypothetical protein
MQQWCDIERAHLACDAVSRAKKPGMQQAGRMGVTPLRKVCMCEKRAAHCCRGCWCCCSMSRVWDMTTTPPAKCVDKHST